MKGSHTTTLKGRFRPQPTLSHRHYILLPSPFLKSDTVAEQFQTLLDGQISAKSQLNRCQTHAIFYLPMMTRQACHQPLARILQAEYVHAQVWRDLGKSVFHQVRLALRSLFNSDMFRDVIRSLQIRLIASFCDRP